MFKNLGIYALATMLTVIGCFLVSYLSALLYYRFKGYKPIKYMGKKFKRGNSLVMLFIKFPWRFAKDNLLKNPNHLSEYGCHFFCGEQGSGKTVASVELIQRLRKRFPKLQLKTNVSFKGEDGHINSWKDMVSITNGEDGTILFLDELQNWFASNESKDFPPDMLELITQQRKQRCMMICTTQVFTRLAKPLREQATYVYLPFTVAGCLTFVRVCKPVINQDGVCTKMKLRSLYCFVHTDEIRSAFDTYERVRRIKKSGFQSRSEQIHDNIFASTPPAPSAADSAKN